MRRVSAVLLSLAVLIAVASVWVASSAPDGLERAAEDVGFAAEAPPVVAGPLPDYTVPGLGDGGSALAGVLGVLAVFALGAGLGHVLRRRTT